MIDYIEQKAQETAAAMYAQIQKRAREILEEMLSGGAEKEKEREKNTEEAAGKEPENERKGKWAALYPLPAGFSPLIHQEADGSGVIFNGKEKMHFTDMFYTPGSTCYYKVSGDRCGRPAGGEVYLLDDGSVLYVPSAVYRSRRLMRVSDADFPAEYPLRAGTPEDDAVSGCVALYDALKHLWNISSGTVNIAGTEYRYKASKKGTAKTLKDFNNAAA